MIEVVFARTLSKLKRLSEGSRIPYGIADEPSAEPRISVWRRTEVQRFVQGEILTQFPAWNTIAENAATEFRGEFERKDMFERGWPAGLDLALVSAAFSWLPPLESAANDGERCEWIAF